MFNQYPYLNITDLNLDFILKELAKIKQIVDNFISEEPITFANPIEWNITSQYTRNTIVLDNEGNAYLSIKAVPSGISLNNTDYWMSIFNFMNYIKSFNSNLTLHEERNTTIATANYQEDDWLLWNDILYIATENINEGVAFNSGVGGNIARATVEQFCRNWSTYINNLVVQYKNDIDASESAYRLQLAGDIANTTANLQSQLTTAISGVTVDSEVINARVGADAVSYPTLGDAIRNQFTSIGYGRGLNVGMIGGTNVWQYLTNGSHYSVPVKGGEIVKIKANANYNATYWAETSMSNIVAMGTVNFSSDTDWDKRRTLNAGNSITVKIPDDARVLGFGVMVAGTNILPEVVEIEGVNVAKNIYDNEKDTIEKYDFSNKISDMVYRAGFINGSNVWSYLNNVAYHVLIPVKGGESFHVKANSGSSALFFAVRSYSTPVNGVAPDFSTQTGWTGRKLIASGTEYNDFIPNDAKYLVICVSISGVNAIPTDFIVNNYNYVKFVRENIQNVWVGSQDDYDNILVHDYSTIYFITEE